MRAFYVLLELCLLTGGLARVCDQKADRPRVPTGCGENQNGASGTIQSPNYPNNYLCLAYCEWRIETTEGFTIELSFGDYILEGNCGYDDLQVFELRQSGRHSLTGQICGSAKGLVNDGFTVTSKSKIVLVEFITDKSEEFKGFKASWKRVDVDECALDSSLCNTGQQCVNSPGSYSCTCPIGFTGPHCKIDVDECALDSSRCNTGQCVNSPGSYSCHCDIGFTGRHCEIDVDECVRDPSLCNTGQCVNSPGSYSCNCAFGFTGRHCEIDPCVPHPCFEGSCHNGTCDFCDPNQCEGGSCINKTSKWPDEIFNFTCVCNEGYSGPYCRLSDDPCNPTTGPKPQCKKKGICRVKIKPGKNDWFCECPGKPVIGQAKDCSTTDPDDVKYPIPAVVMKTVISIPFGAIFVACAVFGMYECLRTGEVPTLTWARIASRLTITTWTKNRINESTETTSPETSAKNVNISIKSETASHSKDPAPVEDETLVKSQSFRDKTSLFNNLKQKLSVIQRVKTQIFKSKASADTIELEGTSASKYSINGPVEDNTKSREGRADSIDLELGTSTSSKFSSTGSKRSTAYSRLYSTNSKRSINIKSSIHSKSSKKSKCGDKSEKY